jgi:hypothetical protein
MYRKVFRYEQYDVNNLTASFAFAYKYALECSSRLILIFATRDYSALENSIGHNTVKSLLKKGRYKDVSIQFESMNTIRLPKKNDVLLFINLVSSHIDKIDEFREVEAVFIHEWYFGEFDSWCQRWGIPSSKQEKLPILDLSNAVIRALYEVDKRINHSKGLTMPGNDFALTAIRTLNKYEKNLNAESVKTHLITQLNWSPSLAIEFHELLTRHEKGKFFQGGEKTGLQRHYQRWVENK